MTDVSLLGLFMIKILPTMASMTRFRILAIS